MGLRLVRAMGVAVACLLAPLAAKAETVNDGGVWFALFAQGDLLQHRHDPLPWKWWFDGHLRLFDDTDGYGQSIVRPGVGLELTDRLAVWAGYGWIRTSPEVTGDFDEHRPWQQLTWSADWQPMTVALRSRLEQRFLETGDDVGLRFRQLFRVQHHLPQSPRISLVVWDELFIHLNDTDWGAESGFDQNRVFTGIAWKRSPGARWRTEIGYLNQFIQVAGGDDRSNHLLSINFYR